MGGVPFLKHTPGDGPISVLRMHARICSCTRQILRKRCRAIADRVLSLRKPYLRWHPICFPLPSAGTGSGMAGGHGSSSPSGSYELLGRLANYLPCASATHMFMQSMECECSFRPVPCVTEGKVYDDPPDGSIWSDLCGCRYRVCIWFIQYIQRHSEGAITHIKDEGMPVKL